MTEKTPVNLKLLMSLSSEISYEERMNMRYECRKIKVKKDQESLETRKKRSAVALILAKIQRIEHNH